jgi:hypothetical protein
LNPFVSAQGPWSYDHARHVICQLKNPKDPWEIIPNTPWGDIPQWMASTLATGTMGAFDDYMQQFKQQFDQFRAHAVTETDSLLMLRHEVDAGMKVLRDVATTLSAARRQLDEERAEFEKQRADAEKFAEPIATPPGQPWERDDDTAPGEDPSPETDNILPQETLPVGEEPEAEFPEELEDPELSDSSRCTTKDEELPPALAKYEPEETPPPRGSVFPSPTAISLNSK